MSHQSPGFPSKNTAGGAGSQRSSTGSGSQSVPVAPYPPFLPPTRRSSLSSSPHYSTPHAASVANPNLAIAQQYVHHSSHASVTLPPPSAARDPGSASGSESANVPGSNRRDRSRSAGELVDRKSPRAVGGAGSTSNRLVCPSRVKFCPSQPDLYACINCRAPPQEEEEAELEKQQIQSLASGRPKKLGPTLLELRRLHLVSDPVQRQEGQLFFSSTVALSRGNPQLGPSVASTCLSVRPSSVVASWESDNAALPTCATGLTTGALCVHAFRSTDDGELTSAPNYFTPRHQRLSSSVAWRPNNTQHVAIGLVGGIMRRGERGARAAGDREFCALVWDVEAQAHSTAKGTANTPVSKLSHNAGVASLAWLHDGQTLAVGCQFRTVQLYDLRTAGSPPISAPCHTEGVNGIEVDPSRQNVFATFSRSVGEPVKLWDARQMDSCLGEIKTTGLGTPQEVTDSQDGTPVVHHPSPLFGTGDLGPVVSTVQWSSLYPGTLFVALGDTIRSYDTMTSGSRPALTHINYTEGTVADMALNRQHKKALTRSADVSNVITAQSSDETAQLTLKGEKYSLLYELQSRRMLVTLADGTVRDTPKFQIAPLAISRRDGRVVHALGRTIWVGSTSEGPSAMEIRHFRQDEDISATMMRRSRCLHAARYSMDAAANIQVLSQEQPIGKRDTVALRSNREELLRLWSWIGRAESLCLEDTTNADKADHWPAKSLIESGVWRLLGMDVRDNDDYPQLDTVAYSDSLSCNVYDSPSRRSALTSCGWTGRFTLSEVLADCEALGEFERSAALAVWHCDIGAAVDALQRGADALLLDANDDLHHQRVSSRYAETLQLVSMCIAGYSGIDPNLPSSAVWRRACTSLLQREELSEDSMESRSGVAYLRGVCTFLINIGLEGGLDKVLYDDNLSLCDRVAFACRFLEREDLRSYLINCVEKCKKVGNLEGLVVTGLNKNGIGILQAYVDRTADVQTAASVSSRVVLPVSWVSERTTCSEWLHSYRDLLLNTWQMWQTRAMFDVDRAELLRVLKSKQGEDTQGPNIRGGYYQGRVRGQSAGRKNLNPYPSSRQAGTESLLPSVPAQLDARCNYCNTSLSGLRRQDGVANQWQSKSKPILSCCPRCRKPLPRCAICLLSLGCLNPYMELKKSRSGAGLQPGDDLTSLANLPFAEWFTWCFRCKHGGHLHHLVGWFANHDVCPVSGCECSCQFDGVKLLNRPALASEVDTKTGICGN